MFKLETALADIKGLPPRFVPRLKRLGLTTVRDALWHLPVRYEDFSKIYPIAELQPNQHATVQGVVQEIGTRRSWRRRMTITEALIGDETGSMRAVWFNQSYVSHALRQGKFVSLAGKVLESDKGLYFSSPAFELLGSKKSLGLRDYDDQHQFCGKAERQEMRNPDMTPVPRRVSGQLVRLYLPGRTIIASAVLGDGAFDDFFAQDED